MSAETITPDSLYRNYSVKLHRFMMRRVKNDEIAQEIVQETFLRVLRYFRSFRGDCSPSTWLFGIAVNVMRELYKADCRQGREHCVDLPDDMDVDDITNDVAEDPAEIVERLRMLQRVSDEFDTMTEDDKSLLDQVIGDGVQYDAAAITFGIPIGTVRSRIFRARKRLMEAAYA